jgi:GNAT superfamily N-acetyltransferase
MGSDAVIRTAGSNDKEGVLELLNNVFSPQQRGTFSRDERYWKWKFRESPFGESMVTVAELDHRIVGVDHLWPWELSLDGSVIRAAQPCDSAVHPGYRGQGIFTSMRVFGMERAAEQDIRILFNFPNANSLPVNRSLGWHYLGKIAWWVRIIRPVKVISGRLTGGQAEPMVPGGQYALDPEMIDRVNSRYATGEGLIRIHRKPGFHAWRYGNHPYRSYGMVHYRGTGGETIAIFTVNRKGNYSEMVIVDLVGSERNTQQVVQMALEAGRRMGAGYLALMNNAAFNTRGLWKSGFIPRRLKNMVTLPLDARLEGRADRFAKWSLMAGMHDSI